MKITNKVRISEGYKRSIALQEKLMTSTRKFGIKKRNPITATSGPGWKPVKNTGKVR
jgi:hypothetical protein